MPTHWSSFTAGWSFCCWDHQTERTQCKNVVSISTDWCLQKKGWVSRTSDGWTVESNILVEQIKRFYGKRVRKRVRNWCVGTLFSKLQQSKTSITSALLSHQWTSQSIFLFCKSILFLKNESHWFSGNPFLWHDALLDCWIFLKSSSWFVQAYFYRSK